MDVMLENGVQSVCVAGRNHTSFVRSIDMHQLVLTIDDVDSSVVASIVWTSGCVSWVSSAKIGRSVQ